MSRVELAYKSGVSFTTIEKIEQGKHMPRLDNLERIAKVLGMTLVGLLSDDTEAAMIGPRFASCAA